jgi:TonB family protein
LAILAGTAVESARAQSTEPEASAIQPPRLLNLAEVRSAYGEHYPFTLRKAGIGGVVELRLYVGRGGSADSVQIQAGTGLSQVDQAALSIAGLMRFAPAMVNGEPHGLWIDLPITLQPPPEIPSPSTSTISLVNRAETMAAIRDRYPKGLWEGDIASEAELWVEIDSSGAVLDVAIERSSCVREIDQVAYDIAHDLRFAPAEESAGPIAGWTTLKLRFNMEEHGEYVVALEGEKRPDAPPKADSASTRRPRLLNRPQMTQILVANYPPNLRDARIGGTTGIVVWIDEKGGIGRRMISESSGNCQLDVAALSVTKAMRFRPAQRNGKPVPTVVSFPVTFRVH